MVSTYTKDGILWHHEEEAVIDREALLEWLSEKESFHFFDLQIDVLEGCGDMVFVSGTAFVEPDAGKPVVVEKFLDKRKRPLEATWLYGREVVIEVDSF